MFDLYRNWMEFFFLVFIVLGILIALLAQNAIIGYVMIFLSGMFAGRLLYERKHKKNRVQYTFFVINAGFVIGYLIGVYYISRIVIIALFVIGAILSYKLFDKKILGDIGLS